MTTFLCNQLRHVPFLRHNIHLRELYLNDNRLVDVKGVLKNLKSLETLLLHNNQLEKLDTMVHEMAHMQCLRTLSMYFTRTFYLYFKLVLMDALFTLCFCFYDLCSVSLSVRLFGSTSFKILFTTTETQYCSGNID